MKHQLPSASVACFIFIFAGCAVAQELSMPSVPLTIEAHVHEMDGTPVPHATVRLALPRRMPGERGVRVDGDTNTNGIAIVSGIAQEDYSVRVEKSGYYPTEGPWRGINDEKGFKKYAVGVQKIDLELRPIRNPAKAIGRNVRKNFPAFDHPLGFDLEVGDWVAPDGQGRVPDFVFTVGGYFNGLMDFDQTLTLTFTYTGDGIVLTKVPVRIGSVQKFPYEAPQTGYESKRVWRSAYNGKTRESNIDSSGETNYIFRVRTELDEKGNVRRALHGVIASEIVIGGNNEIGRRVSFKYGLNPDWTRNIEFDPDKLAASWR